VLIAASILTDTAIATADIAATLVTSKAASTHLKRSKLRTLKIGISANNHPSLCVNRHTIGPHAPHPHKTLDLFRRLSKNVRRQSRRPFNRRKNKKGVSKMKTVTKLEPTPGIARKKRVCAYARVSSDKDAMRRSLSAQIAYYSTLIQRRVDWLFAGVYADDAVSGTLNGRAEFQRMLADCRSGKIDMIITKSISRFARNTLTALETLRELKTLGINVYFERENIHTASAEGELLITLLASFAEEESRSASENCKWRIRKMFREGRPSTGNLLGYRLIDGKLRLIEDEAPVVRRIFADYLAGMGKLAIAKELNALSIPTMHGGPWRETAVAKILRNEKYVGDLLLQKYFKSDPITKKERENKGELPMYYVKDAHEPIIDRCTFDLVQAEIRRRAAKQTPKPKAEQKSHSFTGLIRCGNCGGAYRRKINAINTKYAKPVWICLTFNTLGREACRSQQIPENILFAKTAEVLGVNRFDETLLRAQIAEIRVPAHNKLLFMFKDGRAVTVDWQNPSRRESWTPEMKQISRERQNNRLKAKEKTNQRREEEASQ
jgi:DNA invertase Pin-like site-specific DNA recombinase